MRRAPPSYRRPCTKASPLPTSAAGTYPILRLLLNAAWNHSINVLNTNTKQGFATASLRDPCSGKLLAEGDGLFYLKKLAPPLQDTHSSVRTRYASISEANGRSSSKRPRSTTDATVTAASPLETFPEMIPYDEAIQYFGPINPNACQNLVAFIRGGVTALHRAKL